MTEAGWTREKPTVAGWYWWRRDQHALPGVAIVCSDLSGYYMNRTGHNSTFDHVDDVIGEWLGPITPDSYQQGRVAGLGDVKRYVERQIKIGEDFIGGPDPNIQRRVALDEVIEYCDRQLAQAAQKEKGVGDGKV